jgi:UDP-N-acetylmuramate dehydrogenase
MIIEQNISLKPYNTFGIDVKSEFFLDIKSIGDLGDFLKSDTRKFKPFLVLGGGSNILFTRDFEGTILRVGLKGIEKVREDDDTVWIKAYAGEKWDDLVGFCVEQGFGGVENLSLIPGSVGAAPVQNIGAYGVELKNVFYELQAIHIETGDIRTFTKADCEFSYRNSIFKGKAQGQFIILSVTLTLSRKPVFNTTYGSIEDELKAIGTGEKNLKSIREAVSRVRRSKLPDPAEIGNAGSFFKNPVIAGMKYKELKDSFPNLVAYKDQSDDYKVSAGWLIEACGWKGKRVSNAGVYSRQALILVNYGGAKGKDILELAMDVKQSVKDRFGIELEHEVIIINDH